MQRIERGYNLQTDIGEEKNERINPQLKKSKKGGGKGKNPADKPAKCEMVTFNSNLSVIAFKVNKIKALFKNIFVRLKKDCQTSI